MFSGRELNTSAIFLGVEEVDKVCTIHVFLSIRRELMAFLGLNSRGFWWLKLSFHDGGERVEPLFLIEFNALDIICVDIDHDVGGAFLLAPGFESVD